MEPIKLCRHKESGPYGVWWPGDPAGDGGDFDYLLALPRAEYDALVAERDAAERQADALVGDRGELLARAEKAEAQRDAFISGREMQRERADAATARAERAEAMLELAKDAMENVISGIKPGATPAILLGVASMCRHVATRIDALLDTPTDDDGRGEDGAWVERGGE